MEKRYITVHNVIRDMAIYTGEEDSYLCCAGQVLKDSPVHLGIAKECHFPHSAFFLFIFIVLGGAEGHFPPLGLHYATLQTDTSTPTQAVEWGNKLRGLECRRKLHS